MNFPTIYLAGPMTGLPDFNRPAFNAEALRLRRAGHHVHNPAELSLDPLASWEDCMREGLKCLLTCTAIRLLPGWETSKGALLEAQIAAQLGMTFFHDSFLPPPFNSESSYDNPNQPDRRASSRTGLYRRVLDNTFNPRAG